MVRMRHKVFNNTVIIHTKERLCETNQEFTGSSLLEFMYKSYIDHLKKKKPSSLKVFPSSDVSTKNIEELLKLITLLATMKLEYALKVFPNGAKFVDNIDYISYFIEGFYDYWRSFNRFVISHSSGSALDKRPYRTFTTSIEAFNHITRKVYRDVMKNITGEHPKVFRQVCAGGECAAITINQEPNLSPKYNNIVKDIPIVRQILLYPPLILYPPMNKRKGIFTKTEKNFTSSIIENSKEWMNFPLKVGKYIIHTYIHENLYELGFALSNLFELAQKNDLQKKPAAIYFYGAPKSTYIDLENSPCEFYDDQENDILIARVPNSPEFAYFGYLKKMILTLHNIKVLKDGGLPFHGAFMKILLKNGKKANVIVIGDTGSGKSETIEAMHQSSEALIDDISIIADDMGSIFIEEEGLVGYGSEIGAFLRLDDLGPGYALGQLDRSIIMSPRETNSRIVLPVTTYKNIIKKNKIDYVFYANNHENLKENDPAITFFDSPQSALNIFNKGKVMSKGTTSTKGIVANYFANIFGPPQYKEIHAKIASKVFESFFKGNIKVGELKTQLGIKGKEFSGPISSAKALIELINNI